MERGAMIFDQRSRGSKHTSANSVASGNQKALPLFAVSSKNGIPSPFHTMHSAGRKCINRKNANPGEKEILALIIARIVAKPPKQTQQRQRQLLRTKVAMLLASHRTLQDAGDGSGG
uniref:Uncharacterized protein n=1 Tax=Globodera pallida TaxID=36090 RepID=A0A183CKC7_GLOPA